MLHIAQGLVQLPELALIGEYIIGGVGGLNSRYPQIDLHFVIGPGDIG